MTWHLLNAPFCPKRKQTENLEILNLNRRTIPELSNTRTIPYLLNMNPTLPSDSISALRFHRRHCSPMELEKPLRSIVNQSDSVLKWESLTLEAVLKSITTDPNQSSQISPSVTLSESTPRQWSKQFALSVIGGPSSTLSFAVRVAEPLSFTTRCSYSKPFQQACTNLQPCPRQGFNTSSTHSPTKLMPIT